MKRINKKGFTLVELLAVIVVLAILILLAIPAVTAMMDKARKNAFEVEVENVIKVTKSWYASRELESISTNEDCITVKDLIDLNYLDKKSGGKSEGLDGAVCLIDGKTVVYELSNKYYYDTSYNNDGAKKNDGSKFSDKTNCASKDLNYNKNAASDVFTCN